MSKEVFLETITVFAMGALPWFEIWTAVPLGVVLGFSPFTATVIAIIGNVLSIILMIALFPHLKDFITRKFRSKFAGVTKKDASPRQKRFLKIWRKFGLPGVALAAPFFIGTHLAVAFCLILGSNLYQTLLWITTSIIIWGIVIAVSLDMGLGLYEQLVT
ncbi:MAG: small multi-drug export protein [Desulfotomaculum sp.]|nr:small multi-drug export protein [Desulfotomaculum sp.]